MADWAGKPWKGVFRRIRGVYSTDWWYRPPPTDDELDSVEREVGYPLPASYREFARTFGLGGEVDSLVHVIPLRGPSGGEPHASESVISSTQFHREHDDLGQPRVFAPTEVNSRCIVFAIDGGDHTYLFDPAAPSQDDPVEYPVYDIPRWGEVRRVAESFTDWLTQMYSSGPDEEAYLDELLEARAAGERIFRPNPDVPNAILYEFTLGLRRKNPPDSAEVPAWLAWNNGTVRDLATALRESSRPDGFGVLADALEEAGCRHADLLAACRGDADIDGVWALRVLLGP